MLRKWLPVSLEHGETDCTISAANQALTPNFKDGDILVSSVANSAVLTLVSMHH